MADITKIKLARILMGFPLDLIFYLLLMVLYSVAVTLMSGSDTAVIIAGLLVLLYVKGKDIKPTLNHVGVCLE